jgi:hypothetical protein
MNLKHEFTNKIIFRRLILLMVFLSILLELIPTIFNFERYYGLSRFINQGLLSIYFDTKVELYLTAFMSFFSLTSIILIYFFIPIGKYFFLIFTILNFLTIMFGGDIINYGLLYPIQWLKNVTEAFVIYFIFWGPLKNFFKINKAYFQDNNL